MVLTTNLLAYWNLNSDTNDSLATYNATNDGADPTASGKISGAYDFVLANTDFLYVESATLTNALSGNYSISVWIKTSTNAVQGIVSWGRAVGANSFHMGLGTFTSTTTVFVSYRKPDTNIVYRVATLPSAWNNNSWHHFVAMYDGTNPILYFDGVLVATWGAPATPGLVINPYGEELHIGSTVASASQFFFNGTIDEVGIWDRVLTSAEVATLWNSGTGLTYPFSTAPNFKINIGDAWKTVAGVQINIGDTWKTVSSAQINIGDTWKSV